MLILELTIPGEHPGCSEPVVGYLLDRMYCDRRTQSFARTFPNLLTTNPLDTDGTPTPITRLSDKTRYLPGFDPQRGEVSMRILGPVEFSIDEAPALIDFGKDDKTTNGNSVLMRVDYGRARILLTGDLNKASQQALMEAYSGHRMEFQCDVAKARHHGSEDVSFAFLQALMPAATVICSGDGEGHDHPKPQIVAASGVTGYRTVRGRRDSHAARVLHRARALGFGR